MVLRINDLRPPAGAKRKKKRVGRGNASGKGTYSTRGLKGQRSRSGRDYNAVFEGGGMSMFRTLPRKKGFKNRFRVEYKAINVVDLDRRFADGAVVDAEALQAAGLLKHAGDPFKVLAGGAIERPLTVRVERISPAAAEKIKAAGGAVEVLNATSADSSRAD